MTTCDRCGIWCQYYSSFSPARFTIDNKEVKLNITLGEECGCLDKLLLYMNNAGNFKKETTPEIEHEVLLLVLKHGK